MAQRHAVTKRVAIKYRQATRAEKTVILDQLVELTGRHRDHARAVLRRAGTVRVVARPRCLPRATVGEEMTLAVMDPMLDARQAESSYQVGLALAAYRFGRFRLHSLRPAQVY